MIMAGSRDWQLNKKASTENCRLGMQAREICRGEQALFDSVSKSRRQYTPISLFPSLDNPRPSQLGGLA